MAQIIKIWSILSAIFHHSNGKSQINARILHVGYYFNTSEEIGEKQLSVLDSISSYTFLVFPVALTHTHTHARARACTHIRTDGRTHTRTHTRTHCCDTCTLNKTLVHCLFVCFQITVYSVQRQGLYPDRTPNCHLYEGLVDR